jgi:2-phosphosulfolactate phosphatase
MEIRILQLVEGARKAEGLAVIIDVFRAFSVACYVLAQGARQIIPIEDIEVARKLKRENSGHILMGERGGKKPPDFDFGNSPTQIEGVDFNGRTVIHTTSSGTKGLVNARGADEVITGSFVNASAVLTYIKSRKPEILSLVCMGVAGERETDEDTLCAHYLRDRLEEKEVNFDKIVAYLRHCESSRTFFDPRKPWIPERDFELCLSLNRFSFVLKAERTEGQDVSLHIY